MSTINWQQPYVNTFKHFTIASDRNVVKQGDITTMMDAQIKSNVYKITGTTATSNFITMPKLSGQSLGLTGRYIYFLFKPTPNKCFSLHIDLNTSEKTTIRVSFSNLFKEFKATTTWLQFPFVIQAPRGSVYERAEASAKERDLSGVAPPITRWTIFCVDLVVLMQTYANRSYQCVRGFKLCANMQIKNVVTSDFMYEPGLNHAEARLRGCSALPRELSFPCDKCTNWADLYDQVVFPVGQINRRIGQSRIVVSVSELNKISTGDVKMLQNSSASYVQQHLTQSENETSRQKFSNKFKNGDAGVFSLPVVGVDETSKEESVHFIHPDEASQQNFSDIHIYPFNSSHGKVISPRSTAQHLPKEILETFEQPEKINKPNSLVQTSLQPDPILRLKKLIGFGAKSQIQAKESSLTNLIWSHDSRYIFYSSQAVLIALDVTTSDQHCFVGHADSISCIALNSDNSLVASGQAGQFSLVRIWHFATRRCLSIFRNHDHSLHIIQFSNCGNYLCGVGKDRQSKTMLVIWDIRQVKVNAACTVKVVAKAHTDVNITKCLFIPYDSSRLITCGRENVRFWRLKDDILRSCAVNLSPYIQALTLKSTDTIDTEKETGVLVPKVFLDFSDMCVGRAESSGYGNVVFACTRTGQIFEFNIARMDIENVRVLEPIIKKKTGILCTKQQQIIPPALRLTTLTLSGSHCATGSDDGYLRLWPLDFSQISLEAQHDSPLSNACFSPDFNRIATATLSANLGILDLSQKTYITLLRSHTLPLTHAAIDPVAQYIATASLDRSLRVWNFQTSRQLYDFTASNVNDSPTRLAFHPTVTTTLASAFTSGKLRIFNVSEAKLLQELPPVHQIKDQSINEAFKITDLTYTNDGRRLITADLLKYICLYNVDKDYTLLRMLPNCVSMPYSMSTSLDLNNNSFAVIGPANHLITVYEGSTLNELLRIDIADAASSNDTGVKLAYSPGDINQLVCVTTLNRLIKFDVKNGRQVGQTVQKVHKGVIDSLAVSGDGRFIVTSGDNLVKVWDYEMRFDKSFQAFIGHSAPVSSILFTPDSSKVVTVGESIIYWELGAAEESTESFAIPQESDLPVKIVKEKVTMPKITTRKSKNSREMLIKSMKPVDSVAGDLGEEVSTKSKIDIHWKSDISFEKPRTPPVAAEIEIETIAVHGEIEDTFLNDDLTLLESNNSSFLSNQLNKKLFLNLPNFISNQPEPLTVTSINLTENNLEKRLTIRKKLSTSARRKYIAPVNKRGLKLNSIIGFNGKWANKNIVWSPHKEFFAFTCGTVVCIEDLKTGQQSLLHDDHQEEITVLALRNDCTHMAASYTSPSQLAKISLWDCTTHKVLTKLSHKASSVITSMAFSPNDRFLVSIGDYKSSSLCLWSTESSYNLLVTMESLGYAVNDVSWNLRKPNEFVLCGEGRALIVWHVSDGERCSLRSFECDMPVGDGEDFEMTAVAYSDQDCLMYAASSTGVVTVWNTDKYNCFMNWQADETEIDSIVCIGSRLVTGSGNGSLKLWNCQAVKDMKDARNKSSMRKESLVIENELILNGAIKSFQFDATCQIGIVATRSGTLWYVNWHESTSVRLMSSHSAKINTVKCINEKYLSTASDDGSVCIWSFENRERLVQFEVKSASAICQTLIESSPANIKALTTVFRHHVKHTTMVISPLIVVAYSDGSVRIFDADRKCIVSKIKALNEEITVVNYCQNTSALVVGTKSGKLAVLDLNSNQILRQMNDHSGAPINSLDSVYDETKKSTYLLAASHDRRVSVWHLTISDDLFQMIDWLTFPIPGFDGKEAELNWSTYSKCLARFASSKTPVDTLVVSSGFEKELIVYNFVRKQVMRRLNVSEWPECVDMASEKNNLMALGTDSRLLQLKDFNEGTFQDYSEHSDAVTAVEFDRNGKRLVSAAFNEIFIWDVNV